MARVKITLTPQLEASIRSSMSVAGNVTPFASFLVQLIRLGLSQYDADLLKNISEDDDEQSETPT